MKLGTGHKAPTFTLPNIDHSVFNLNDLAGKRILLSFYRFAACPFCNLRVYTLIKRFNELGKNFTIVAIFDSPLEHLQQHAAQHQAPFPILADELNQVYRRYSIEHSLAGTLKGMVTRAPALMSAMFVKGYFPTSLKGKLTTMPADFLINEAGTIETAHYGKDEGDHLEFEKIKRFSAQPL